MPKKPASPVLQGPCFRRLSHHPLLPGFNESDLQRVSLTEALSGPRTDSLRRLTFHEFQNFLGVKDFEFDELSPILAHQNRVVTIQAPSLRYVLVASPKSEDWFVVSKHEQKDECSTGETFITLRGVFIRTTKVAVLKSTGKTLMLSDPVHKALAQEKPAASTGGQETFQKARPATVQKSKQIDEGRRGTKRKAETGQEIEPCIRLEPYDTTIPESEAEREYRKRLERELNKFPIM